MLKKLRRKKSKEKKLSFISPQRNFRISDPVYDELFEGYKTFRSWDVYFAHLNKLHKKYAKKDSESLG